MKKNFFILLILVLSFSGCGTGEDGLDNFDSVNLNFDRVQIGIMKDKCDKNGALWYSDVSCETYLEFQEVEQCQEITFKDADNKSVTGYYWQSHESLGFGGCEPLFDSKTSFNSSNSISHHSQLARISY